MDYSKKVFGAIDSKYDIRDYTISVTIPSEEVPETFELKKPKIKNQGAVGSCVAHSCSYLVENFNRNQEDSEDQFSVGYIYGTREIGQYQGQGMRLREALSNLKKYGDVKLKDFNKNLEYPEIVSEVDKIRKNLNTLAYPHRISTYFKVTTKAQIQEALMKYGFVTISVPWYADCHNVKGVITTNKKEEDYLGGHAITIYGWNQQGWVIANSWGESWGNKGSAILPYSYEINEAWGVTDNIVQGKDNSIVTKNTLGLFNILYKIINFFMNHFKK